MRNTPSPELSSQEIRNTSYSNYTAQNNYSRTTNNSSSPRIDISNQNKLLNGHATNNTSSTIRHIHNRGDGIHLTSNHSKNLINQSSSLNSNTLNSSINASYRSSSVNHMHHRHGTGIRTAHVFTPRSEDIEDDVKAYQNRLTEVFDHYKRPTKHWRLVFFILLITFTISLIFFVYDLVRFFSSNEQSNLTDSSSEASNHGLKPNKLTQYFSFNIFYRHKILFITFSILVILVVFRQNEKMVSTDTLATRLRECLKNFAMSCDENGKLKFQQVASNVHGR